MIPVAACGSGEVVLSMMERGEKGREVPRALQIN